MARAENNISFKKNDVKKVFSFTLTNKCSQISGTFLKDVMLHHYFDLFVDVSLVR